MVQRCETVVGYMLPVLLGENSSSWLSHGCSVFSLQFVCSWLRFGRVLLEFAAFC